MRPEYREEPCASALNRVRGLPFLKWSLNPYTGCVHRCTFCYVRAFERRADRPSDGRYGTSIRVKVNVVDILQRELRRPRWAREAVTIGAATDAYQPAEGRYRLTRGCIAALTANATPFGVITRSPLVVRDSDILAEATARAGCSVSVSAPSHDARVWRTTEPGTAPPSQRLRAVETLAKAGVRVGVAIAPVIPGLSDSVESIATAVRSARDAGASFIWSTALHLRPGVREHFLEALARDWPSLLARYGALYTADYLPARESAALAARVASARSAAGLSGDADPIPSPTFAVPTQLAFGL